MTVTGSARSKSLGDKGIGGMFPTNRTAHKTRDMEMSIMDAVDFDATRNAAIVGNHFVIEVLQF